MNLNPSHKTAPANQRPKTVRGHPHGCRPDGGGHTTPPPAPATARARICRIIWAAMPHLKTGDRNSKTKRRPAVRSIGPAPVPFSKRFRVFCNLGLWPAPCRAYISHCRLNIVKHRLRIRCHHLCACACACACVRTRVLRACCTCSCSLEWHDHGAACWSK